MALRIAFPGACGARVDPEMVANRRGNFQALRFGLASGELVSGTSPTVNSWGWGPAQLCGKPMQLLLEVSALEYCGKGRHELGHIDPMDLGPGPAGFEAWVLLQHGGHVGKP